MVGSIGDISSPRFSAMMLTVGPQGQSIALEVYPPGREPSLGRGGRAFSDELVLQQPSGNQTKRAVVGQASWVDQLSRQVKAFTTGDTQPGTFRQKLLTSLRSGFLPGSDDTRRQFHYGLLKGLTAREVYEAIVPWQAWGQPTATPMGDVVLKAVSARPTTLPFQPLPAVYANPFTQTVRQLQNRAA